MNEWNEIMKLKITIDGMSNPVGKLIAASSWEYQCCIGGMMRAKKAGNHELFDKWAAVMHRLIPDIASNPRPRHVSQLVIAGALPQ